MKYACAKMGKRFLLVAACVFAVAGCGSSSSSTGSSGTGGIAAKLVWSSSDSKSPAKSIYAAPAGVLTIKVNVTGPDFANTITKDFTVTPGVDGSGTVDGIPVGTGRTVKFQGLDGSGIIRYQAQVNNVEIKSGETKNLGFITMTAPVTKSSIPFGSYSTPFNLFLNASTASKPATIYYTTNGSEPTTSVLTKGLSPLEVRILGSCTLKFFAVDAGGAQEKLNSVEYKNTKGALAFTW